MKHILFNTCTNKAFSSTSTRFNPYVGWCYRLAIATYILYVPGKVGFKSFRYARECFICT